MAENAEAIRVRIAGQPSFAADGRRGEGGSPADAGELADRLQLASRAAGRHHVSRARR